MSGVIFRPFSQSLFLVTFFIGLVPAGGVGALETSAGDVRIERITDGLAEPWSLTFLPDGRFLVTERDGRLTLFSQGGGDGQAVTGLPEIHVEGQGGLFDVVAGRDFTTSRRLYISYAAPQGRAGSGTALASATLSQDGTQLDDLKLLWVMPEGTGGGRHFGGRIVEAPDGHIFLTIGERGDAPQSQNPAALNGKVIRLLPDGNLPQDNPFIGQADVRPEIWSLGHRNPQGATLDANGQLWVSEHGARGGDEVNRVVAGANYGWPVITYGTDYDGSTIGTGTEAPGMEQPAHYWDPSIAPSGHIIYSGKLWPDWQGDHFLGSLKFGYLSRLDPDGSGPGGWAEERLRSPETGRIRDVREAPDGSIWFLSVERGAVFRITPAQ
ncbi:MAG: PQQ-dependent sugar dehydrogenase [Paracoccaceae bacterium]